MKRSSSPGAAALALLLIGALAGLAGAPPAHASPGIAGRWRVEKKDAIILIEPKGGHLAGHVVWAKDRDGIRGEERLDFKNPRPELRARKVLGLEVLSALPLEPDDEGWHGRGRIYNPKTGKTYPVKVKLAGPDRLRLKVGGSLLSQTTDWTRVP